MGCIISKGCSSCAAVYYHCVDWICVWTRSSSPRWTRILAWWIWNWSVEMSWITFVFVMGQILRLSASPVDMEMIDCDGHRSQYIIGQQHFVRRKCVQPGAGLCLNWERMLATSSGQEKQPSIDWHLQGKWSPGLVVVGGGLFDSDLLSSLIILSLGFA